MDIQVVKVPHLKNGSPAAIDRENGILYLNDSVLPKYSQKEIEFIILHEFGHYYHQTDDEGLSDQYAFNEMLKTSPNLKDAISALSKSLPSGHVRIANAVGADYYNHAFNGHVLEMQQIMKGNLDYFDGGGGLSAGEMMRNPRDYKKLNHLTDPVTDMLISEGSSVIGTLLGAFGVGKKDKQAAVNAQKAAANASIESARLNKEAAIAQTNAALATAQIKSQQTKTMIIALSVMFVLGLSVFIVFKVLKNKSI